MSYHLPITNPRAIRRARQPMAQHVNASSSQPMFYPLSLADAPAPAPLATPSTGIDLRTLLMILAAAGLGIWLYQKFFAKKKKVARNANMYFVLDEDLRAVDRVKKRLFSEERMDGNDMRDAAQALDTVVRRVREQTLDD